MRIIGGEHGGRKFNPPNNMPYTRPTTDIAKEGLFNVIQNRLDFEELKTLDLFGGTGSISYELASRGVNDLTIVEKDTAMYEFIKKTSAALKLENFKVIKMDVFKFIMNCPGKFDFIFAGPPYALTTIDDLPKRIFEKQLLNKDGWFVLEHTPRNDYKILLTTNPNETTVLLFSLLLLKKENNAKERNTTTLQGKKKKPSCTGAHKA